MDRNFKHKAATTYISLRPERYSYEIIRRSGEFVINLTDADMARSADLCGMYTGRKRDKATLSGLKFADSYMVRCPTVLQSPLSLECRVMKIMPLGSHHIFMARILRVSVRDDLVDEDGRIRLDKAELCAFAHGEYFALGRSLGKFGFSAVKKVNNKRKR